MNLAVAASAGAEPLGWRRPGWRDGGLLHTTEGDVVARHALQRLLHLHGLQLFMTCSCS
jgi:hypothetical protein